MIARPGYIIIKVPGKWVEEETTDAGIIINFDPDYRREQMLRTIAEVVGTPKNWKDYVDDEIKVGDKVRIYYHALEEEDQQRVSNPSEEGILVSIPLDEVLYVINEDGSPKPLSGWTIAEPVPVPIPKESVRTEKINGTWFWFSKSGLAHEVDFSSVDQRAILRWVGEPRKGEEPLDASPGDVVITTKHSEFPNNGHNEILGKKYFFIRHGDIIGKEESVD
jgi:co-chaperonin GroES (HSP10)